MICHKCGKEYLILLNAANRKIEVLKESMHKYELSFIEAGNDVCYDRTRHKLHIHNSEVINDRKKC